MKDLLKTSGAEITNLKEVLKNWKPSNKIEVVKMLSFISVTNNATVTKKIKDACYEYLNNRCAECENAIDPESGLEVKRIEVNKNIINDSLEIQNIKKEIEVKPHFYSHERLIYSEESSAFAIKRPRLSAVFF